MDGVERFRKQSPAIDRLLAELERGGAFRAMGAAPGARGFLAALLRVAFPDRPLLVVVESDQAQERLRRDLSAWLAAFAGEEREPPEEPLFYPAWDVLPRENRLPHADVISERLETLLRLQEKGGGPPPIILAQVKALLQRTLPPDWVRRRLRRIRAGAEVDPLELAAWLQAQGYEREAQVTGKGEYAARGGILDVFPMNALRPVRIEFFGNTVESMREFDPGSQRAVTRIAEALLGPGGELGMLRRALAAKEQGEDAGPAPAGLHQHLPPETLTVWIEPEDLARQAELYRAQCGPEDPLFEPLEAWRREAADRGFARLELTEMTVRSETPSAGAASADLELRSLDPYRPVDLSLPRPEAMETQRRRFFEQMHRWLRRGFEVIVFCNNEGEARRFQEVWEELIPGASGAAARPRVRLGSLGGGFLCERLRLAAVSDAEIFGRYKLLRPRRLASRHAEAARSVGAVRFADLRPGDYVVHVRHGIGRFAGVEKLPPPDGAAGEAQECLVIEYSPRAEGQPPPRLYVPVTEAHLVGKYVGAGRARPPLNTLGGNRWAKTKARAAEAVRDLAAELLSIQAARMVQPGVAYPPDTPWQREFESAFIYEETPDQAAAIEETKRDLESPRPMDRLICGDVGFGKTEVAVRAAFKAVMAGKQVAVLAPTTVLAHQHFHTFSERMADYPIRIELLSRFRSQGAQRRVVRELAEGSVDIAIGTHRLLSGDVRFKDLGLVVIDEEQRFGVAHKERLKTLRKTVDVLTLSATPIPRTLYLALAGARDLSVIETPPQDRLPVETIVAPYDETLIREAIERELGRGGQVYFLHNRVRSIEQVGRRLRALAPEARIEIGHGQMPAKELEAVMTRFVEGKTDVLLCTTIIESGVDIPNANTIIIDRADRFGLSDLYQLRGRVGRYKHQAYAYLLLPRHAGLLVEARKRLSAIRQYSAPGSGFKIALKDLEIRGAGNLLGKEQSGHIAAVGFELYCRLLEQSVRALKGEETPAPPEVNVRLDFLRVGAAGGGPGAAVASLPEAYIPNVAQRVEMYRRLAGATSEREVEELAEEARDRFGPMPPPAALLFDVYRLKMVAAAGGVSEIETREGRLMLRRGGGYLTVGGRFPRLTARQPRARLREIRRFLERVAGAVPAKT